MRDNERFATCLRSGRTIRIDDHEVYWRSEDGRTYCDLSTGPHRPPELGLEGDSR